MKELIQEAVDLADVVAIMTEGNKHLYKNYTEKLRNTLYEIQENKQEKRLKANLFYFFSGCFLTALITYTYVL